MPPWSPRSAAIGIFCVLAVATGLARAAASPTARSHVAAPGAGADGPAAAPSCRDAAVRLTDDYAYAIGSAGYADPDGDAESGSTFRWLLDGATDPAAPVAELLAVGFDGDINGRGGETPVRAAGTGVGPGRWGEALALGTGGMLAYSRASNLALDEGTIELWLALTADGDDPVYAARLHVVWQYRSPGGDWIGLAIARDTGILYAGGQSRGQRQSAYSSRAATRG